MPEDLFRPTKGTLGDWPRILLSAAAKPAVASAVRVTDGVIHDSMLLSCMDQWLSSGRPAIGGVRA